MSQSNVISLPVCRVLRPAFPRRAGGASCGNVHTNEKFGRSRRLGEFRPRDFQRSLALMNACVLALWLAPWVLTLEVLIGHAADVAHGEFRAGAESAPGEGA